MPPLTAQSAIQLQLEDVNEVIPFLVEITNKLDSRIKDNGRSTQVSLKSFRVRIQTADVGDVAKFQPDGGTMPLGGSSEWDQFLVTPIAFVVPIQYTRLADEVGEPKTVSTTNPVSKTIADAVRVVQVRRDMFLQTNGDGKIATIDPTYVAGNNPIILASSPWGARLCRRGQQVQVMKSDFTVVRGTCTIQDKVSTVGLTQTIRVDQVPNQNGGAQPGDIIVVNGIAPGGADPFVNGIPVFHNTNPNGNLLGVSRQNNYVVANGVNANNAQVTLPLLRLAMNQVEVELGEDALGTQIYHTHPSQLAAYEELGFKLETVFSESGKFNDKGFDGLFNKKKLTIDGYEIVSNLHADNTRWDFTNVKSWGKVRWGGGTRWFKNRAGTTVFQQYDFTTGTIKAIENSYLVDYIQYYVDNPKLLSSLTSCRLPALN
ncbi:MAG TPA: hypothetical protein VKY85_01230 [Candidatus Angelobacter sp.]|nr:hypothetical protein [Candidatus Angelobacter sp.]